MNQVISVLPNTHFRQHAILKPLPQTAVLYTDIVNQMGTIPSVKIISIEEIRNPMLEETYEGMKRLIIKQCPGGNPNEQYLFHGTRGEAIAGIVEDGFTDRYFCVNGMYGHGAYFADSPIKSHSYTAPDPTTGTRVIYYAKVLLGKSSILTTPDKALVTAPKGYESVTGRHTALAEYVIYRYDQASPYLKIVYTAS